MTVKEQIPLLRQSQVPTPDQIREKLYYLFPHTSRLLKSILDACAEETERMCCEVNGMENNENTVSIIKYETKLFNYRCNACYFMSVQKNYFYCPKCGTKIKWI